MEMLSPIFSLLAPHLARGSWCCFLVDVLFPSSHGQITCPGQEWPNPDASHSAWCLPVSDEDQESQPRREEEEEGGQVSVGIVSTLASNQMQWPNELLVGSSTGEYVAIQIVFSKKI